MIKTGWWNLEGWPTSSEWQALWMLITAVTAVVAVSYAVKQLKALKESNESVNDANKLAAESVVASNRPYIVVAFEFAVSVPKSPTAPLEGSVVFITIQNIGKTAAQNVRLKSTPILQSSNVGTPKDNPDKGLNWIRNKFSGDYIFRSIPPGRKFEYVLDLTRELMKPENNLPQSYEIEVEYFSALEPKRKFEDIQVIDAEPWHLSIMQAEPLEVLAAQMKRHNIETENFQESILKELRAHRKHPPSN